jgi:hypothetical protein
MDADNDKKYFRVHKKGLLIVTVLFLLVGAVLFGLWVGRSVNTNETGQPASSQTITSDVADADDVTKLVKYTLPDGWKQARCDGSGSVYVIPNGVSQAECDANPVSPVKLAIDPGNNTDCNQLQNVSEVKKHICISLYINGKKTLKATTEYLASSSYGQPTTINAYYLDTGKGVVKIEYNFTSDNKYQAGFDELANSIQVKS